MANYSLDLILIALFLLVQWRVTVILLAATRRRALRYAIFVFDLFLTVSYAFTFPIVLYPLRIPTRLGMLLGAVSLLIALGVLGGVR